MHQKPIYKKVGFATLIMMASVFLSRVFGLVREMVIAKIGGISGGVDAYQVAFVLPEILNHVVATGFLSITFIPIFSGYLAKNQEDKGWDAFWNIFYVCGGVLLLVASLSYFFAPFIISFLSPGLSNGPVKTQAIKMTQIILPAQFFFFSGGMFMAVQYSKERFIIPALAPLFYNIGIILGGLILGPRLGMEGFCWGVLAGALLGNCVLQFIGAWSVGMRFKFTFNLFSSDLKTYFLLSLPLIIGLGMTFSTEFFLRFFGSYLPEGGIASINYALRIMFFLVGFFGQAVGVASYPYLSRLFAEGKIKEMNVLLNKTLCYLFLSIPISILFIILRKEVVIILFQRGAFDAAATASTSSALFYILIGTVAFVSQTVVVRGFYASKNTWLPTVFNTLAVVISVPLFWLGLSFFKLQGLALAISISAIMQVGVVYLVWNIKTQNKGSHSVYFSFLRLSAIGIGLGIVFECVKVWLLDKFFGSSFFDCLILCFSVGPIYLLLLIGIGKVFHIEEIDFIRQIFSRYMPLKWKNRPAKRSN